MYSFKKTRFIPKVVIALSYLTIALLHANRSNEATLEPITVTSVTKTQKSIDGVSASVVVIDKEKIAEMGSVTLGDIINKTSGIVRQFGTFASATSKSKSSISLRGMGASSTLFLINGKRMAGEADNAYDLDRIPASAIERVEIVKGAMSSLYGADAVGGVINIITKKPAEIFEGSLGFTYGANLDGEGDNSELNFHAAGREGKLTYSLYGSGLDSKPYYERERANILFKTANGKVTPSQHPNPSVAAIPDSYETDITYRDEANVYNLGASVAYDFTERVSAGVDIAYMKEERKGVYNSTFYPSGIVSNGNRLPAFNVPINAKDENTRRSISGDITWIASDRWSLNFQAYHSDYKKRNTTTMRHYQDFGFASEADSASNSMNGNAKITSYELMTHYAMNDAHLFTMGSEYRNESRDTTIFTQGSELTKEHIDYKALYMQDEWEVSETLNVVFGGRYDIISIAEDKPTFRVGAVKQLENGINLRANFAQAYRTPDMKEIYINKQTPIALIVGASYRGYDLKPEFTNSYEIAMGGQKDGFEYDVALFFNQTKDRIEQVAGDEPNTFTYENVSKAETKGIEARVSYTFANKIVTGVSWNELRTENKDTGKSLEFTPNQTINVNLDIPITKNLKIGTLTTYIGEQEYSVTQSSGTIEDKTTDAYTLVDATASYIFGDKMQYRIHGGVNNLMDEKVDVMLGSNVGRYLYLGASLNF
ncbi:MAG: TonB-dependent receptor [Epsilonproteobacteria bacterium]|nr:TonB-dependent receptor [Campylobacterota bacterium]